MRRKFKNVILLREKIKKINKLLVKQFGFPHRKKKLPDPIDTLIATILSQNTNDKNSFQAFNNLKNKFNSWQEASDAPRKQIEAAIKVAGLGKQKSAAIKNTFNQLKKKNGKLDLRYIKKLKDEEILNDLTSISGIGVKTASCVLLFSLDRNVCPVDTHVHRTLNRIGLVKTNSPEKTFYQIYGNLPDGTAHQFHTNLIKLGREICKSAKPICILCPLLKICEYNTKNLEKASKSKNNNFLLLDSI
jgi:endonuclease-3